jgi:hypothetical protein
MRNNNGDEEYYPEDSEKTTDNLAEYLEYLTRITPTTLPEWAEG